jgi:hypothetical protein
VSMTFMVSSFLETCQWRGAHYLPAQYSSLLNSVGQSEATIKDLKNQLDAYHDIDDILAELTDKNLALSDVSLIVFQPEWVRILFRRKTKT